MNERLSGELMDAANNTGAAIKKKKILIKWLKQTKLLHIIVGNLKVSFI